MKLPWQKQKFLKNRTDENKGTVRQGTLGFPAFWKESDL